jgi:sugar phosphate isomerase/epimerase
MTPREIIQANLEHAGPPRPGFTFDNGRLNDFVGGGRSPDPDPERAPRKWIEEPFEYSTDEWGNVWRRMTQGCAKGEIWEPAIQDWSQLETIRTPSWDDPARYQRMREVFEADGGEHYRVGFLGNWVFADARYLRRMDIYLMDLIESPDHVERLHAIITDLLEKAIRNIADAGADAIFFCEDLGTQDRPLIGPAMWRQVFAPHYERLCAAAHERGMKVLMHSCGYNWDLLDDIAATGVDCFQFDQPALYDMPALAEKLKAHRIALYSPLDIQKILPTGDREYIEREARRLIDTFEGFLILKNYPDLAGIGIESEWDQWAYEAFLERAGVAAV